ncbi:Myoglobin 1 [Paragonimus heterotremus]|uniref:Myoglobin 1 n=1 Tax=Paragonimus heterotremus TaxID=100268 RepID=A0A8J4SUC6_9TREM|nr:Myoglobin 1 [Paragonimus heterotremus]
MAPLTQAEVDGVVAELSPFLVSDAKKVELGLGAYKALFKAKPEYIQLFSKLQGLNTDNVFQSDGIKYYAGTLVAELVRTFTVAAKEEELNKALIQTGQQHTSRNVNKQQLISGEPIFIDFFNKTLCKPENKAAMEKFLKHAFPAIASHI